MFSAALFWPAGLTLLLAYGAYSDIRWRRLPNWLALVTLLFGFAFAFATGGTESLLWHGAHSLIALIIGMALFAVGAIGGGDAKFYTGTAAYFGLSQALQMLLWVSLTALALVLAWIVMRRLRPKIEGKSKGDFVKFPYGVAIATGAALLAWWLALGPAPVPELELVA